MLQAIILRPDQNLETFSLQVQGCFHLFGTTVHILNLLERRLEGSVAIGGIVKYKAIAVDWSEPVEKNKLFAYPRSQPSLVFPLVSL